MAPFPVGRSLSMFKGRRLASQGGPFTRPVDYGQPSLRRQTQGGALRLRANTAAVKSSAVSALQCGNDE